MIEFKSVHLHHIFLTFLFMDLKEIDLIRSQRVPRRVWLKN